MEDADRCLGPQGEVAFEAKIAGQRIHITRHASHDRIALQRYARHVRDLPVS